jgi:hypothetical protein
MILIELETFSDSVQPVKSEMELFKKHRNNGRKILLTACLKNPSDDVVCDSGGSELILLCGLS